MRPLRAVERLNPAPDTLLYSTIATNSSVKIRLFYRLALRIIS